MTNRDAQWRWVVEQRIALADSLAALDESAWDEPSLCAGWQVRDVVGHLVHLAEGSRASVLLDVARQLRLPDEAVSRVAKREGQADPGDLVDRLRAAAGGRFVVPTQGPPAALGEVIVHGIDALRPSGAAEPALDGEASRAVAETYRNLGPVFRAGGIRRIRFEADDAAWSVGPADGPVATGAASEILLAMAGRDEGRAALRGPGADLIRR